MEKEALCHWGDFPVGQKSEATATCVWRDKQGLGCNISKQTGPVLSDLYSRFVEEIARRGLR
jgi:hypothetical protein